MDSDGGGVSGPATQRRLVQEVLSFGYQTTGKGEDVIL